MPLSQNMSMSELSRFRTRICERKALHGVCELDERCPFSHCLSWHRRNPYEYAYRPNLCPNVVFQNENRKMRVKNYCQRGRMCMFSHTKEEQMYHVLVYKTQLCREYPLCTKHYCPFAHGLDELRDPEKIDFDPVQGPEVIERQRLIHDSNKFSEKTDNLEKQSGNGTSVQDAKFDSVLLPDGHKPTSSFSGDPCVSSKTPKSSVNTGGNDSKNSPRATGKTNLSPETSSISTSLGSSPRRGTNRVNSSYLQKASNNSSCSAAAIQNPRQLSGELTPVSAFNDHNLSLTPSTGCETPLHSKGRQTQSKRMPTAYKSGIGSVASHSSANPGAVSNPSLALSAQDAKEQINSGVRSDSVGISATGASTVLAGENGDDFLHARDCVNIPPPPYGAIGLNFPYRDSNGVPAPSSCGLPLPNYDFGKLSWISGFEEGRDGFKNLDNSASRTGTPGVDTTSGMDDYENGTGVEQMSYLMHLQLLSLSDTTPSMGKHNIDSSQTRAEWSGLGCASSFGIGDVCCGGRTIGDAANGSDDCCISSEPGAIGRKVGNPGTRRGAGGGDDGLERNTGACMAGSQFYYPNNGNMHNYTHGFINKCNDDKAHVYATGADYSGESTVSGPGAIGASSVIKPEGYGLVDANREEGSSPWGMFHPALLNASNNGIIDNNNNRFFCNEGKWKNITTNNY
ncbi:hypothetical protein FG386_002266 [Cryptosporidium ryanae]|uniref:uncharacterized protein n=1 Tax=Cryptosporidium ryanae TaxID=515981 RepID=UPI00351A9F79|nr:hypothetical protein FG386_002266 [Cryptosporidium ryanae]